MSTEVDFPTANLDMSPYLTPELAEKQNSSSSYLYDLTAVAHHSGTLHGGHYVAHVDTTNVFSSEKRPPNWMCFNDSRVTPTSTATIGGSSAYILFYRLKRSIS